MSKVANSLISGFVNSLIFCKMEKKNAGRQKSGLQKI